MHGLIRCNNNTGVRACAGGADVSLRDVTIAHIGSGVTECGWRHAPEEFGGFWEILKKSVSLDETCLGGRRLVFACSRRPLWRVPPCWGADEKARIERLCLCPYVEEPLKSKVIKRFVPELRSRYVFFEFRDSYVLSLWTFDVRFTHSHIMAMVQWKLSWKHSFIRRSSSLILKKWCDSYWPKKRVFPKPINRGNSLWWEMFWTG